MQLQLNSEDFHQCYHSCFAKFSLDNVRFVWTWRKEWKSNEIKWSLICFESIGCVLLSEHIAYVVVGVSIVCHFPFPLVFVRAFGVDEQVEFRVQVVFRLVFRVAFRLENVQVVEFVAIFGLVPIVVRVVPIEIGIFVLDDSSP